MEPVALGTLALSAAGAVVGVEVIKKLIMDKIFPPKDFSPADRIILNSMESDLRDMKDAISGMKKKMDELHTLNSIKDNDGVPLVYIPRSLAKAVNENLNVTRDVAFSQKETAKALESVTRIIERLAEKIAEMRR